MYFVLEDPMLAGRKIDPPAVSRPPATASRPPSARKHPPFAPELRRFAVSEGAEQHVGFWLVVLGIVGFLALVALIGFGPR
jgi:hypothetical protein